LLYDAFMTFESGQGRVAVMAAWVVTAGAASGCTSDKVASDAGPSDEASADAGPFRFGLTPGAAAVFAGWCELSLLDIDAASCTGAEAYVACAEASCGLRDCASGACSDYTACLVNSADSCNGECTPSATCTCLQTVASCATTHCIGTLSCGATDDGGACAALDMCCSAEPDQYKDACSQLAAVSRVRGDVGCRQILDLQLDSGPFTGCLGARDL
jgi:hypothetical protein